MKEININIEGYNVNGICVGCLNYNRKMFYNDEVKECFKFLADIDVPDGLTIQVCWECLASVRASNRFQAQILRSYDVLIDYSQKHTFLNSPLDLSQYSNQRLTINSVDTNPPLLESKDEPKEEVEVEVKSEVDDDDKFDDKFDVDFELEVKKDDFAPESNLGVPVPLQLKDESSDEDIQLSRLKRKKKKEKRGRREKKRDKSKIKESKEDRSRNERKLKNLPPDLVELYTMTEEEMWQVRSEDLANIEFINLKYKCTDCIIKFNSEKLMVDHMNGKHKPKSEDCQQCDVCKAYFLTKDNLSVHRALHRVAFRCVSCNSLSTLKRVMLAHAREHGPAGAFICNLCDETFITKSKLTYHKNMCHQERPQCDCCGKVFANKMTLKYHLKILPQNREDKPKEKLYIPCKGCSKVFHSKKSYRAHVVIHDGLTYPCPTCGKQFQWKRNLARHARNHRDRERGTSHECRECHKTFSSRDCYNNHMRLSKRHAREESLSHECHFCGKKFATKWCMTDHIDWDHLKRVKYQCNVCFKAFKTAKIMVAHINNIHEGKKKEPEGEHLCEICGKSYKTVKRLKGHVWAMHTNRSNTKSFKCKLCPATFTWQTSIYKHTKMMHDDSKRNKVPRPVKKQESFVDMQQVRMQYLQVPPLGGTVPNTTIIHNIV